MAKWPSLHYYHIVVSAPRPVKATHKRTGSGGPTSTDLSESGEELA